MALKKCNCWIVYCCDKLYKANCSDSPLTQWKASTLMERKRGIEHNVALHILAKQHVDKFGSSVMRCKASLGTSKEHLHWFLATALQCNKHSFIQWITLHHLSSQCTVHLLHCVWQQQQQMTWKKSKRLWTLALSFFGIFLEMISQVKHINEMNGSLGTTRACTIYHNTLFLVAKEKTSLSLKLKQQKIKLNQFDIMLNDMNDLFP